VLNDGAVVKTLREQMMEIVNSTPQAFSAFMREEDERWAPVIAKNKITRD
jgi:tripartite-type tricarboxylate transporter receptor subunit TctC